MVGESDSVPKCLIVLELMVRAGLANNSAEASDSSNHGFARLIICASAHSFHR